MSDSIVKYNSLPVVAMKDLQQIGEAIAQSGMFGVKNAASGLVVAATCHQQGITLLEFIRTFYVIEGVPSMRADAMLAAFVKRGGKYNIVKRTDEHAEIKLEKDGRCESFSLTWGQAQQEPFVKAKDGGLKKNWKTPRARMQTLWARVVSDGVRVVDPEVVAGLYTPEEVEDFHESRQARQVEISVTDAAQRATTTTKTIDIMAAEMDFTTCPVGGPYYEGRKWEDIETEVLQDALGYECAELTEGHRNEIRRVLFDRAQ